MNDKGSAEGIIKLESTSQLPQEFIKVGKDFEEALGRCVLRDDNQKTDIILYKAQLDLFNMTDEVKNLTAWLNASPAVGGFNRSLAAMTYTGIYVPEGAGVKMSKESHKLIMEAQQAKERARGRANDWDSNDNQANN